MLRSMVRYVRPVCARSFSTAGVPKAAYLSSDEVQGRVAEVLSAFRHVDAEKVAPSSHLVQDLRFDSLLRQEAYEKLQTEFCIPIPHDLLSVPQIVQYVTSNPKAK